MTIATQTTMILKLLVVMEKIRVQIVIFWIQSTSISIDDFDKYPKYRNELQFIQSDINLIRIHKADWIKPKRQRKNKAKRKKISNKKGEISDDDSDACSDSEVWK